MRILIKKIPITNINKINNKKLIRNEKFVGQPRRNIKVKGFAKRQTVYALKWKFKMD